MFFAFSARAESVRRRFIIWFPICYTIHCVDINDEMRWVWNISMRSVCLCETCVNTIYRLVLENEKKNPKIFRDWALNVIKKLCLMSISIDSERSNWIKLSRSLTCKKSKNYVAIDVERGKSRDDLVTHFPYGFVGIGLRYSIIQKRRSN